MEDFENRQCCCVCMSLEHSNGRPNVLRSERQVRKRRDLYVHINNNRSCSDPSWIKMLGFNRKHGLACEVERPSSPPIRASGGYKIGQEDLEVGASPRSIYCGSHTEVQGGYQLAFWPLTCHGTSNLAWREAERRPSPPIRTPGRQALQAPEAAERSASPPIRASGGYELGQDADTVKCCPS